MKKLLVVLPIVVCCLLLAQAPPPTPVAPDTVVVRIDGKAFTAAELNRILKANPPEVQKSLLNDIKGFLLQVGLMQKLTAAAEKEELDKKSPAKEQLEQLQMQFTAARNQILATAQYGVMLDSITVTIDEQKKFYETNKAKYTQAKVKSLFVSFQANPPAQSGPAAKRILNEAEAKAKIEKLLADVRGGADFVKAVKANSDDAESVARDGDFGQPISASDATIPAEIAKAVFSLKPGQVSDPVRQKTGYYLFRLEELTTTPFEQVRDDIFMEIRQGRFNEWEAKTKGALDVKIENEAFFKINPAK